MRVNKSTDKNEVYLLFPELHKIHLELHEQGNCSDRVNIHDTYDMMYHRILVLEGSK